MDYSNPNDSTAIMLTGKILVISILVIFLAVVIVVCLQLYARWFWSRIEEGTTPPNQIRRRRRRFVFAPGQDPTFTTTVKGLEPSVLKSLPVLIFNPQEFKEGLECAVCLSELCQGEKARLLPKCNHGFHLDCIDMWFQSHSTCPICRNSVVQEISSNDENGDVSRSSSSTHAQLGGDEDESQAVNLSTEVPIFPTNVLFWGNQGDENSLASSQNPCSSSSSSSNSSSLLIDIPNEVDGGELKSPVSSSNRLRSLKRLLSREKRVNPCSQTSIDVVEQGGVRGQS